MRHNMGKTERTARLIAGIALFLTGWIFLRGFNVFAGIFTGMTIGGIALSLAGAVVFVTGLLSWCPINAGLKSNTCPACKSGGRHTHMPV